MGGGNGGLVEGMGGLEGEGPEINMYNRVAKRKITLINAYIIKKKSMWFVARATISKNTNKQTKAVAAAPSKLKNGLVDIENVKLRVKTKGNQRRLL